MMNADKAEDDKRRNSDPRRFSASEGKNPKRLSEGMEGTRHSVEFKDDKDFDAKRVSGDYRIKPEDTRRVSGQAGGEASDGNQRHSIEHEHHSDDEEDHDETYVSPSEIKDRHKKDKKQQPLFHNLEDAQRKAAKVLLMLSGSNPAEQQGILGDPDGKLLLTLRASHDYDSLYESLPDPHEQMKNVPMLMHTNRKAPWEEEENPSEEYLEKKEIERLENIHKSRPKIFTWIFHISFHVCVILNFFMACVDSFRLMVSESKLQALLLKGDFNCLEITTYVHLPVHVIHIFQAMMSAMTLYADNKENASLCMSCVFAQAVHASYKSFYFFMQMRFDEGDYFYHKLGYFIWEVCTDVIVSVVAIQRFYDLTDRIRARSSNFAEVTEGMSMNNEIIYQNQSSFLQRKHILREAIASQTYTVIQKIDNYRKKGLEVDHLELFKELLAAKDALSDVDEVENRNLLKELKKATAKRFRQYGTDPHILQDKHITIGQLSKIFLVDFGERDNPLLECKPSFMKGVELSNTNSVATHASRQSFLHRLYHHHEPDLNAKPIKPILHHHHHEGEQHPKAAPETDENTNSEVPSSHD